MIFGSLQASISDRVLEPHDIYDGTNGTATAGSQLNTTPRPTTPAIEAQSVHLPTTHDCKSHAIAMSFFRITLHRSAIGLPKNTRGVLEALGLHRRSQTVFHPVKPEFAGMIMKVKELVKVDEVDRPLSKFEMKEARRPDPGFYVEKAVAR
ncbi:ribosomal protein L30 [Colletotrichum gloeosporioides Cg-14]|uniref:Large ribosomal subunit protein uL30m n=1 Tax=Colletotrichum gloeosporioides (strain Cg-14) TaxID=1237896 RepID=T0KI90_COLGC|nr:ribosomal protein L30 [Colletotrichum gloeosporioides Cg-14]